MAPVAPTDERGNLAAEDELGQYRAVSGSAVAGLLLALFSILTYVHPLMWLVAVAAIVLNAVALKRIAETSPAPIGRKAALTGLALSLIIAIGMPLQINANDRELRLESLKIAEEWFTALRDNRPELAHRLTKSATTAETRAKPPLDEYKNPMQMDSLRKFSREPLIELLLKLGKRAHVRLFEHDASWEQQGAEGTRDYYVVTVGNGPDAVSFFMELGTTRTRELTTGKWQWQVTKDEFLHAPVPEIAQALGG
jgi:hypothetical protein